MGKKQKGKKEKTGHQKAKTLPSLRSKKGRGTIRPWERGGSCKEEKTNLGGGRGQFNPHNTRKTGLREKGAPSVGGENKRVKSVPASWERKGDRVGKGGGYKTQCEKTALKTAIRGTKGSERERKNTKKHKTQREKKEQKGQTTSMGDCGCFPKRKRKKQNKGAP